MKKKIQEIAAITSGVYAKPEFEGEVYYIQARHFDENHQFDSNVKPDLFLSDQIRKHLLQAGDIIVAAKGNDHFAIVCKGKLEYAVASSVFMVVRIINKEKVLPEYLAWFINHPQTQQYLRNASQGSSLPTITKSDIGEIIIPVPTLKKQKHLIYMYELFQKQLQIKKRIITLNEKVFHQQVLNSIK